MSFVLGTVNAQSSAQWRNYILFAEKGNLYRFDMTTNKMDDWITQMSEQLDSPCIATDGRNVYVIGGGSSSSPSFQQYDLSRDTWTRYVSKPMKDARRRHACAVHNGFLYAFGGLNVESNEKISVGETIGSEWTYIAYDGTRNKRYHRAVVHELYNQIYLVGGRNNDGVASSNIQLYDIASNTIHVLDVELGTRRSSPAAIIVDNVMYVFGGIDGNRISSWERSNELTLEPTHHPSSSPTSSTLYPTKYPSLNPTELPSLFPTLHPSISSNPILPSATNMVVKASTTEILLEPLMDQNENNQPIILFIIMGSLAVCCIICAVVVIKCNGRHKAYRYDEGTIIHADNVQLQSVSIEENNLNITPGNTIGNGVTPGLVVDGITPGVNGENDDDDAVSDTSEKEQTLGGDNNEMMNDIALPMESTTKGGTNDGSTPIGKMTDNGQTIGNAKENYNVIMKGLDHGDGDGDDV